MKKEFYQNYLDIAEKQRTGRIEIEETIKKNKEEILVAFMEPIFEYMKYINDQEIYFKRAYGRLTKILNPKEFEPNQLVKIQGTQFCQIFTGIGVIKFTIGSTNVPTCRIEYSEEVFQDFEKIFAHISTRVSESRIRN